MQSGVITGEGVVLEAEAASVISRVLAGLIDYTLYLLTYLVLVWLTTLPFFLGFVDETGIVILQVVIVVFSLVGIPLAVELITRGRSLGRLAAGTRIVRDDGGAITFRHALIRSLTAMVEIWFFTGVLAAVSSAVNPQGKRLGDLAAGTYAIRVRGGPRDRIQIYMPSPMLGQWAARADVAHLPDPLALAIRQFLGRARRLHPGTRVSLGQELSAELQRYVHPLPPTGTHPEAFMMAVLAERRNREQISEQKRVARTRDEAALLGRLPYGVPESAQN